MDQSALKAELRNRLESVRARTLSLMDLVSDEHLRVRVHEFYSPIGWHFGHLGRTEEYWVIVQALGQPPMNAELSFLLADLPENPKDNRTTIPDRAGLQQYMSETRVSVLDALDQTDLCDPNPLTYGGYGWNFAIEHECQHQETIVEMLTLISRAQQNDSFPEPFAWQSELQTSFVELPGNPDFIIGTDNSATYDNEQGAHRQALSPFKMARYPVTAFQWSEFMQDGGYQNARLWSPDGWSWRELDAVTMPEYWIVTDGSYFSFAPKKSTSGLRAIHPDEPVGCLSWFEAEAFAQWSGHRLPTEFEWEFAASATTNPSEKRLFPWGNSFAKPDQANAALHSLGPLPVQNFGAGENPWGISGLGGNLWEWTSSTFLPYPGFKAFPYAGYSQNHMKGAHRVCRGGSFATSPEILRSTFRNWYVPTYRQGFLGMRLAQDLNG